MSYSYDLDFIPNLNKRINELDEKVTNLKIQLKEIKDLYEDWETGFGSDSVTFEHQLGEIINSQKFKDLIKEN